jgi:uncharacterized SAM-binding protein YcdF (DUF218 family)
LIIVVLGLLLRRRKPRLGVALTWTGIATLLVLSLPIVSLALEILVRDAEPLDLRQVGSAEGIVVLGGGLRRNAPEYHGDTLNRLSLERVRYAAKLARETHLPVLVAGGNVYEGRAEADVMSEVLEQEYNVRVRWVEGSSRNTHENAIFSARLLKATGVSRVLLVCHAVDCRRAQREFRAAGMDVIPAPTVIGKQTIEVERVSDLIPSMSALSESYLALYELLGNIAVTLHLNG